MVCVSGSSPLFYMGIFEGIWTALVNLWPAIAVVVIVKLLAWGIPAFLKEWNRL